MLRSNPQMARHRSTVMRRIGHENGTQEARKAVGAIGKGMTKHQAHTWLNQVVAAGIVGKNADDAETWEWGCRIMFMLEIRDALVD
jgi:hypothetical protein